LRTADITGKVELPENVKMVMPGDNVTAVFELILPVPLEPGQSNLMRRMHFFLKKYTKGGRMLFVHATQTQSCHVHFSICCNVFLAIC
jgi:hypothetical protein